MIYVSIVSYTRILDVFNHLMQVLECRPRHFRNYSSRSSPTGQYEGVKNVQRSVQHLFFLVFIEPGIVERVQKIMVKLGLSILLIPSNIKARRMK